MTYKKLVRDHIPNIIRNTGETPITRTLSDDEFALELRKKLVEEALECAQAKTQEEFVAELADIEEVIQTLLACTQVSKEEVERVRVYKQEHKGGFSKRIFLEDVR